MARLPLGQQAIIQPHYPHMMQADVEVWTKYLQDPVVVFKQVWYDVHVGSDVTRGKPVDEMTAKIAAGLTRKRIDVVAQVGGGFWVIEIKPRANMTALGQVLTYSRLFALEYEPAGEVWPVVICDEVDDDLLDDFERLSVAVIQV